MVLDELKGFSDDFSYTEDHVIFLLDAYRALVLRKEYNSQKKQVSLSNFKTICLDLHAVDNICGEDEGFYLRSTEPIPNTMEIASAKIHPCTFFTGEINMVTMDRLKYSGEGRFSGESIYGTIGPDKHLYLKSSNPQLAYLEKVQITAVFESSSVNSCNPLEEEYPIETAFIPIIIEATVKELAGPLYRPEDPSNDSKDGLSKMGLSRPNGRKEQNNRE